MTDASAPLPAVNPKIAAATEVLKKKMATATLVSKEVFAGGRLGVFKLKPDTTARWWYQAGQYTTLGLDTPTGFVPRAYSIAGSPLDEGVIEFYIALVEGGALTPTIFALVMVATGTGLAPFVAQIRTLWKQHLAGVPSTYRIILFHGSAYSDEFGYAAELEGYAAAHTQGFDFTYLKTSSRPEASRGWTPSIAKGRVNEVVRHILGQPLPAGRSVEMPTGIDAAAIRELIDPAKTAFLACGNPGMIEDLKEPIAHIGVSTYLVEEFWKA
jgi:ferredoxin-NADP reductase